MCVRRAHSVSHVPKISKDQTLSPSFFEWFGRSISNKREKRLIFVKIFVNSEGLETYRQDLKRLRRTLRQLERESPFSFTVILPNFDVTHLRMVSKPSYQEIRSVLNPAHPDIYTANPKGQAFRQRVEAARGPIRRLRERAVKAFIEKHKPKVLTRSQAQHAYAIVKAMLPRTRLRWNLPKRP